MTGERSRAAVAATVLVLVLVALVQQTLLNLVPLVAAGHWWPLDLALTAVLLVCARLHRAAAAGAGFAAGLVLALVPPTLSPIGATAGVLACAGYAAAAFAGGHPDREGDRAGDRAGDRTLPHDAGIAVVGPRVLPAAAVLGFIAGVVLVATRGLALLLGTTVSSVSSLLIMAVWQGLFTGVIAFGVLSLATARRVRSAQRPAARVAASSRRPQGQGAAP